MIALDSDLLDNFIKIFIKKESITIDNSFQNFIKHLRLPVVISIHQKEEFKKPAIAKQQGNLFRIVRATDDRDLSKKAKLRIILSDRYSYFPYININQDVFETNFTATYIRGDKSKMLEHIKSLIYGCDKVEIYDKYLFFDNQQGNNIDNHYSVEFLRRLLSNTINFDVKCFNYNQHDPNETNRIQSRISLLRSSNQNINFIHRNFSNHDRYINIYKKDRKVYEIILSSGIFNILNPDKDITYVVRVF
jgi:hypothetical protein